MNGRASSWGRSDGNLFKTFADVAKMMGALSNGGGGEGKQNKSRGWLCDCMDCNFALARTYNWPERAWCAGCKRAKATALCPPAANSLKHSEKSKDKDTANASASPKANAKTLKKREGRTRQRQARREANQEEEPAPAVDKTASAGTAKAVPQGQPDPAQPSTAALTRLAIPDEVREAIPLLKDLVKFFDDSLWLDVEPPDCEARDAEAVMNKVIGESGPTAKLANNEKAKADIDKIKIAISALDGCECMADHLKKLQQDLEVKESALAKAEKSTPSAGHEEKALIEARASYVVRIQVRKDRAKGGQEKAKERQVTRQQRCTDIKAQMDLLLAAIRKLEVDNEVRFTKRLQEADALDDQVLKNFDAKIASAKAAAAAATPAPGPAASSGAQQGPATLSPATDNADEHMKELEVLRSRVSSLTGDYNTMLKASMRTAQFEKHVADISLCDLPILEEPNGDEATALTALFAILWFWDAAGGAQAFDWELLAAASKDIKDPILCFKAVLGQKWSLWFSDGDPQPSDAVPRQAAALAFKSLQRLQTKLCQMDMDTPSETKKRAEEGFKMIQQESAKKLRSQ
jgi:hypothetical protein